MIIKYKYGFEYKGFLYGWKDKELFRLPTTKGMRTYGLLPLKKWNDKGYYIGRDRKSFSQIETMTNFINFEYQKIKDKDVPF